MEYETAAQMAQRLGVNIRTVQLWAKAGKLPNAVKQGRDWLIPIGTDKPERYTKKEKSSFILPYPLLSRPFEPGKALETAQNQPDELSRTFALGEYYYFSGQPQQSLEHLQPCLDSGDALLRLSALALCVFSCLSGAKLHELKGYVKAFTSLVAQELENESVPQRRAYCLLISANMGIIMHRPTDATALYHHIKYLPQGLKLWGFYLLAHFAYLDGNPKNALGIIHTVLALPSSDFPIPQTYLHLCAAMCQMTLKNPDIAKAHMEHAFSLSLPDELFSGISQHYSLLCGLPEVMLKSRFPDIYQRIVNKYPPA